MTRSRVRFPLAPQEAPDRGPLVFSPGQPGVTRANDRTLGYGVGEWVRHRFEPHPAAHLLCLQIASATRRACRYTAVSRRYWRRTQRTVDPPASRRTRQRRLGTHHLDRLRNRLLGAKRRRVGSSHRGARGVPPNRCRRTSLRPGTTGSTRTGRPWTEGPQGPRSPHRRRRRGRIAHGLALRRRLRHIATVTGQPTQWIVERGSID